MPLLAGPRTLNAVNLLFSTSKECEDPTDDSVGPHDEEAKAPSPTLLRLQATALTERSYSPRAAPAKAKERPCPDAPSSILTCKQLPAKLQSELPNTPEAR